MTKHLLTDKYSTDTMIEFNRRCKEIILGCKVLLERKDKETTKRLRESMVGFGIEMDELCNDTETILNES